MASLADKFKSLGIKTGLAGLPVPAPRIQVDFPIETAVDGHFISTRLGDTFISENHFPLDHQHGKIPILFSGGLDMLALWAGADDLVGMQPEDFVFLDTETSGLSGGTGTYAFMVGVGRFETEQFHLAQFFMQEPGEEAALLEALAEFLAPARVMVTYNGKGFDAPLLKTRYRLHGMPIPFSDMIHLDLLPLARRLWRDRLPSRTLKYIEEHVLGAPRSSEEVPGYEIPYLYFDYLRNGDARPLMGVFYHNSMDIVALAAMLHHMNHMLVEPLHESIQHGLDRIALARLFEELGNWDQAAQLYERGLQEDLPEMDFSQAVRRLSSLHRRRGDLVSALELWQKAAIDGHVYAHIELAKHHEHRQRDPETALRWVLSARELVQRDDRMPEYIRRHWMEDVSHRLDRLEKKTNSRGKECS
jgi:uncharacterized protein YprB with RNaseH-like and TPR domain